MKKTYIAPNLEVEVYELSTSIASNCNVVVDNGPAFYFSGHYHQATACAKYVEEEGEEEFADLYNVNFYDSGCCDCYTTGSGGYWTS